MNHQHKYEQVVLGAILIEANAILRAAPILRPEMFETTLHQHLYRCLAAMHEQGVPMNIITVVEWMRAHKQLHYVEPGSTNAIEVTAYQISQLTNIVASSANLEHDCRIIAENWLRRHLLEIGNHVHSDARNDVDVFDAAAKAIDRITNAVAGITQRGAKTLQAYVDELDARLRAAAQGKITGVPSRIPKWNSDTGGYQKGEFVIIAGRPGMGKTTEALNEIAYQLTQGFPVVVHTLEMAGSEIVGKLISLLSQIDYSDIRTGKVRYIELYEQYRDLVAGLPLTIYEDSSLINIRMNTLLAVKQNKCAIVYIDHLGLIRSNQKGSRYEQVGHVSRSLKQIAKEAGVPFIALNQLSRAVETRGGDKRPQLSDLRDSGDIEQDADCVEFMYRPEYYGIEINENGDSMIDVAYRFNAKMRNATPYLEHRLSFTKPIGRLTPATNEYF